MLLDCGEFFIGSFYSFSQKCKLIQYHATNMCMVLGFLVMLLKKFRALLKFLTS
jgi:hypothetical protein